MKLTTYRIGFTDFAARPKPLTVVTNRFDTVTAAIRYHLIKHLGTNPALISYLMHEGTGTAHLTMDTSPGAPVVAEFTFRTEPGPTDVEVGANAELAGTSHCPTCGSPEWNAVNVECEDCAAEVEKFGGLLDILDEYDVHAVDEVDDNPERNPHVGFVPFEKTGLPERLLAWKDAAVQAALAARLVTPGSGEYPGTPGTMWTDRDGDRWILCEDGRFRLRTQGPGIDPYEIAHTFGPMAPAEGV
jgi:hypothetical protein